MFIAPKVRIDEDMIQQLLLDGYELVLSNPTLESISVIFTEDKSFYVEIFDFDNDKIETLEFFHFRHGTKKDPDLENYCPNWTALLLDPETTIDIM